MLLVNSIQNTLFQRQFILFENTFLWIKMPFKQILVCLSVGALFKKSSSLSNSRPMLVVLLQSPPLLLLLVSQMEKTRPGAAVLPGNNRKYKSQIKVEFILDGQWEMLWENKPRKNRLSQRVLWPTLPSSSSECILGWYLKHIFRHSHHCKIFRTNCCM